ncbi:MAG: T9SS type A sorting domain-containing protein [Paludibacter sp.]
MKKQLLLLSLVIITISAQGQISIPNGDFETWSSSTYDLPENYYYSSNLNADYDAFNVTRTLVAYHGSSAVKLVTNLNGFGYFINCNPNNGDVASWKGGMAYNQKPTGLRGYYKYNVTAGDVGVMIAKFTKAGVDIGTYNIKVGGDFNDYKLFNFTFYPALTQTPDSVIFGAVSSDFTASDNGVIGSTLYLDSVSFTGVTSQPANMNGDFEKWSQSQTPYKLVGWPNKDNQAVGVNRTSDVPKGGGQYALELKTYLSKGNTGNDKAQNGYISTGYYDQKCNCLMGGQPFINKKDTLSFWYKYTQASTGNGEIDLMFKSKGTAFSWEQIKLSPSVDYKYVEFPFNINQVPDSVIIQIISSSWQDTLVSFVGCDLKIDNLYFKSQKTNTGFASVENDVQISIYPNPSDGYMSIRSGGKELTKLEIYSPTGVMVYATSKFDSNNAKQINISNVQSGIYFVKVFDKEGIYTKKILIK